MKSTAPLRELSLPPLKRHGISSIAALLIAIAGPVLVLERDASAVAGPPALPNLNVPLTWTAPATPTLGSSPGYFSTNIAEIINRAASPLQFDTAPPTAPVATQGWSEPGGHLAGSFQTPWHIADTDFNPLFTTSYWNQRDGMKNTADAPWNRGMAGRYDVGEAIFDSRLAYTDKTDFSGLVPVWNTPTQNLTPSGVAL